MAGSVKAVSFATLAKVKEARTSGRGGGVPEALGVRELVGDADDPGDDVLVRVELPVGVMVGVWEAVTGVLLGVAERDGVEVELGLEDGATQDVPPDSVPTGHTHVSAAGL